MRCRERSELFHGVRSGIVVAAMLGAATAAGARTPTASPGNTPTPTPTSNRQVPVAVISVAPNPARSGDRVVLDATKSSGAIQRFEWRPRSGGPAVTIEDELLSLASFVAPEVDDLSIVTIDLFLPSFGGTASGGGSVDVAVVPSGSVLLDVESVSGAPGSDVEVSVTLHAFGDAIAAIEHDLGFDRWTPMLARDDGLPDCSAGAGAAGVFAFVPEGCDPETTCTGVSVSVSSENGSLGAGELYRCRLGFSTEPSDDCEHRLECGEAHGLGLDDAPIGVVCRDGRAVAEFSADAEVTFSLLEVTPSMPLVGDEVTLRFSTGGRGGIPSYQLNGAAPHFSGDTYDTSHSTFGTVDFTLRAECPGNAQLHLTVSYETRIGCVGREFFGYKLATSEVFSVALGDVGGFSVRGRVAEFPSGCSGAMRGVAVTLEPLGVAVRTDVSDGGFALSNVPAGDYTLHVSPGCNPYGCWPPTSVSVIDEDAFVVICPLATATATPSPTPTPTPSETRAPAVCAGDCDQDGSVVVAELIRIVNIGLERIGIDECPQSDADGDGAVMIEEMIRAVRSSLTRCGAG